MAARTMAVALLTLLLSPVASTKMSFADSVGKLGTESPSNVDDGDDGAGMGMPIPKTPESDPDGAATTTLELRLANSVCPRLAQWVEFASKCELTRAEPIQLDARSISHPH